MKPGGATVKIIINVQDLVTGYVNMANEGGAKLLNLVNDSLDFTGDFDVEAVKAATKGSYKAIARAAARVTKKFEDVGDKFESLAGALREAQEEAMAELEPPPDHDA
jgi:hypothetical protein